VRPFAKAQQLLQPQRDKPLMGDAGDGKAAELAEKHITEAIDTIYMAMTVGMIPERLAAAKLMLEIAAARALPATSTKRTEESPVKLVVATKEAIEAEAARRLGQH
jgi:hypothetical protein